MDEETMDEETMAVEAAGDGGNHAARAVQSYIDKLKAEIARLKEAIRRLADQDATLSACDGNVTVTIDATLTDKERKAIAAAIAEVDYEGRPPSLTRMRDTLRGLLERTK